MVTTHLTNMFYFQYLDVVWYQDQNIVFHLSYHQALLYVDGWHLFNLDIG